MMLSWYSIYTMRKYYDDHGSLVNVDLLFRDHAGALRGDVLGEVLTTEELAIINVLQSEINDIDTTTTRAYSIVLEELVPMRKAVELRAQQHFNTKDPTTVVDDVRRFRDFLNIAIRRRLA